MNTPAMEAMGRAVVCLAAEVPAEVYDDVARKWDAACAEHQAIVAALEDENDRLYREAYLTIKIPRIFRRKDQS